MNETDKALEERVAHLEECMLTDKPVGAAEPMTKRDYIIAGALTAAFLLLVIGGAFL